MKKKNYILHIKYYNIYSKVYYVYNFKTLYTEINLFKKHLFFNKFNIHINIYLKHVFYKFNALLYLNHNTNLFIIYIIYIIFFYFLFPIIHF